MMSGATGTELMVGYAYRFYYITFLGGGCLSSHAATEVVSCLLIVLYCHHDYLRTVRFSWKLHTDEKVKNLRNFPLMYENLHSDPSQ